jgi:autotransporter-associated beta strand protein
MRLKKIGGAVFSACFSLQFRHCLKSGTDFLCLQGLMFSLAMIVPDGSAVAEVVQRTVGPFDVSFYNSGDSDGITTGSQSWSATQMDDIAASIGVWADRLTNTAGRQIKLHLFWNSLDNSIGQSWSPSFGDGNTSWTYAEHVWRDGVNYSAPWSGFDAAIEFDKGTLWNFGAGAPNGSQIDFRSVAIHEIGHALGINGSYSDWDNTWGNCWGTSADPFEYAGYQGVSRWDQNLRDTAGNSPNNGGDGNPNPFNITNNPAMFVGSHAANYYGGNVPVYAPDPYEPGSSLYHVDYPSLSNAVMSPFRDYGEDVRNPLNVEWEIMKDLGWVVLKRFNNGTASLSWGAADNWDYSGVPDDMNRVLFTNTGIDDGYTVDLGGDRTVNSLSFDTTRNFTIGGSSGTLTLTSGGLTRTASSSGTQTIARPVALGANGVFDIAGSGLIEISGVISGNYSLEKRGAGTLVLTNSNTYRGGTTIADGTLQLSGGNNRLSTWGAITISGGVLDLDGYSQSTISGLSILGGIIQNGTIGGGTHVIHAEAGTIYANIATGMGLSKSTAGTLTLLGSNSFGIGAVTIIDGTVQLQGGDDRLGSDVNVYFQGGVLDFGGSSQQTSHYFSFRGGIAQNGTLISNVWDFDGQAGTVSANLQSAAAGLTKTTAGTLVLTGANTYAGATTISEGVLQIGDGVTPGAGSLGAGNVVNSAALVLNRPDNISVSNAITGAGSLEKKGSGVAEIYGSNSYDGLTTITAGTLIVRNAAALGTTASGTTIADGATLDVYGFNLGGETITLQGSGAGGDGAIINSGSSQINALRYVTLSGNATFGGYNRWDVRGNDTPGNAALTGNGFNLTKTGYNSIFLVNLGNTDLGNVYITGGTLGIQGTTTFIDGSTGDLSKPIVVAAGASLALWGLPSSNVINKKLTLQGGTLKTTSGAGSNNTYGGEITVDSSGGIINVYSGTSMTLSGNIIGAGGVTKNGPGTVFLTGSTIDFDGNTAIDGGTCQINSGSAATVTLHAVNGIGNLGIGNSTLVTADSISVSALTLGAGCTVVIAQIPGGPVAGDESLIPAPEPSAGVLLILAAMGVLVYRRSRV